MNLEKAIEILTAYKAGSYEDTGPDLDDAIQLGIEALQKLRELRTGRGVIFDRPLPGETPVDASP